MVRHSPVTPHRPASPSPVHVASTGKKSQVKPLVCLVLQFLHQSEGEGAARMSLTGRAVSPLIDKRMLARVRSCDDLSNIAGMCFPPSCVPRSASLSQLSSRV